MYSSVQLHEAFKGKIGINLTYKDVPKITKYFSLANIQRFLDEKSMISSSTSRLNAILTDGTSILGLGNIGPSPGLPVM